MKNSKFLSVLLGVGMNLILSLPLHSTAVAQTFSLPVNVSNTAGSSQSPGMAVDASGHINVVWMDDNPGNFEILFSQSTDGGVSFSLPVNISNNAGNSFEPAIAVNSAGNLYAVSSDNTPGNFEILFSRSTDGGATFSVPVNISNDSRASFSPAVAIEGAGNLNVVWLDNTLQDILFTRSTDGGISFSIPKNISNTPAFTGPPAIAIDAAGNIYVAWSDSTPGNLEILLSRSTDGGASFSTPLNVSNTADVSFEPAIAVDNTGNINVVWDDRTLGSPPFRDILFSRSTDGGVSFSAPLNISNTAGDSAFAGIAADSAGGLNVVWTDITPGNLEILFSRSTDGGTTFSSPANISNNPGVSAGRDISVDTGGNISVIWVDNTPGNFEILYARAAISVTLTVSIDIKPGSFPNSINPQSKGKVPLAILTTDTFDATTVDSAMVLFGKTGTEAAPVHSALEDVDGDGDTDMILHFKTQDTGIVCGDTSASLTGETFGGQAIEGSDSIKTVGCK